MFPDVGAFRAWLLARRHVAVGYPVLSRSCPLAWWLSEVNGHECWVSRGEYGLAGMVTGFESPEWAHAFEDAVDLTCPAGQPVIGEQALGILNEIVS